MKKALICFCTLVFIMAVVMPLLPLQGEGQIYDSAIRLHVLANSDSEEDQTLKLKVRDNILKFVSDEIADCSTRYEAERRVEDIRDNIGIIAQNTVYDNGYDYDIHVTLANEYYPTREYEGVSMPAGTYLSLKVMIGDAQGQNWWCVLYPPLCTSSAKPSHTLKEAGFTPSQIRILTDGETPRYKLKFKILELLEEMLNR